MRHDLAVTVPLSDEAKKLVAMLEGQFGTGDKGQTESNAIELRNAWRYGPGTLPVWIKGHTQKQIDGFVKAIEDAERAFLALPTFLRESIEHEFAILQKHHTVSTGIDGAITINMPPDKVDEKIGREDELGLLLHGLKLEAAGKFMDGNTNANSALQRALSNSPKVTERHPIKGKNGWRQIAVVEIARKIWERATGEQAPRSPGTTGKALDFLQYLDNIFGALGEDTAGMESYSAGALNKWRNHYDNKRETAD